MSGEELQVPASHKKFSGSLTLPSLNEVGHPWPQAKRHIPSSGTPNERPEYNNIMQARTIVDIIPTRQVHANLNNFE